MKFISFRDLRKRLLSRKIEISDLFEHQIEFQSYCGRILDLSAEKNLASITKEQEKELEAFILLCLDCYAFDPSGNVLISDHEYDEIMNAWKKLKHETIVYPDAFDAATQWPFIKHKIPGIVGTLDKCYTYEEIKRYWDKYLGVNDWIIAPKFDGISSGIEVRDGEILYGATRYDGVMGQDITKVLKKASNAKTFFLDKDGRPVNGFYKVEVLVDNDHFQQLLMEKKYANRRSATSGIVNSPKNLNLAKYLTIIPLLYFDEENIVYSPPGYKFIKVFHPRDLLEEAEKLLTKIRTPEYPYRIDGVVMYPVKKGMYVNRDNLLQDAMAYKINTNESKAKILFGYVSVGRLGNTVPMVKLPPTELNEVYVTDASLGSWSRFQKLGIHEGEEIIIFSAGDVIPQAKLQKPRIYEERSDYLKIKTICPFCNHDLEKTVTATGHKSTEYQCVNPTCPRVASGRLVNFAVKLGMKGFSDKTLEDLYSAGVVTNLADLLKLTVDDLKDLPGYTIVKAAELVSEIEKIKTTQIETSRFLGALGIPNISELKCRKMLSQISLSRIFELKRKKAILIAQSIDGIGKATAEVFVNFVKDNEDLIQELLQYMNVIRDITWKGSVVFTKFRSPSMEQRFNEIGYVVKPGVTKQTAAVVCGSSDHDSDKCAMAMKLGIPVFNLHEVDDLIEILKKREYDDD